MTRHPSDAESETVYLCDRCNTGGLLSWIGEHARTTGHTYSKAVHQPLAARSPAPQPDFVDELLIADRLRAAPSVEARDAWPFTREDVANLEAMPDGTGYASIDDRVWFASLISRIASLLPPEKT
jgi:hypothetical protein